MNALHTSVYLRARAYWTTRHNDIHVPLAYLHARQLLLAHPRADADVVIPAILMHDAGWIHVSEEEQLRAFNLDPTKRDDRLRRLHETEGARIAHQELAATDLDRPRREAIVRIIDGHDSRVEPLSLEDSLVKDADKVWRFTPVGVALDVHRFRRTLPVHLGLLEPELDRVFFTARGKALASAALDEVKRAAEEVGHV